MVKTVFHKSKSEFLRQHAAFLANHYYLVHPLLNFLYQQGDDKIKLDCVFTITDDDAMIIGAQGGPCLLLYSLAWNEALFNELRKQVKGDRLPQKLLLSGTHSLIEQLLSQSGKSHQLISARNVYVCQNLTQGFQIASGSVSLAELNDIDAISQLSHGFQQDEYGERFNHDIDYLRNHIIIPGITNGNIAKWVDQGQIVSMAQVMFGDEEEGEGKPEIGHFYTAPEYRGKGYGSSLIWQVTQSLLKDYGNCGLIARQDNPISNAVFQKVGYELRYTWQKVMLL